MEALLPLLLLVVVFYFLILRPSRKRQQEQRATVAALEPGREVMTASGLFGTVSAVGERIEVEIADGVRVEFLPAAISKVLPVADAADQLDLDDEAADDLDLSDEPAPVDGDTPPQ